jgi:hypothetical protein
MNTCLHLLLNIIMALLKVLKPGGSKALVAKNLVLKQQLLIMKKKLKRSPKLNKSERIIYGLLPTIVAKSRLPKIAVIISLATLLKFHKFVSRQLRLPVDDNYGCRSGSCAANCI